MTTDERLDAVARHLDTLTRIHLDNDREYRERFQQLTEAIQGLARNMQGLTHEMQVMQGLLQQDAENIRALARIAELHQQRLDRLEEQ